MKFPGAAGSSDEKYSRHSTANWSRLTSVAPYGEKLTILFIEMQVDINCGVVAKVYLGHLLEGHLALVLVDAVARVDRRELVRVDGAVVRGVFQVEHKVHVSESGKYKEAARLGW